MDNRDVFRYARELVDRYGSNAPTLAAKRVDAMLDSGDLDGVVVWKRLCRAIEELSAVYRLRK